MIHVRIFVHFSSDCSWNVQGKDGAPVTTINDISQDRQGMMWFATTRVLISFDSRVFRKYAHDPKKPNTVPSDYIERVLGDKEGNFRVATLQDTLIRHNR